MTDTSPDRRLSKEQASQIFTMLVGELHLSYTALEHELSCLVFVVVTHASQQSTDVILALLGSNRMTVLKETIKRLLRATEANQTRTSFVKKLFDQLGEIQFLRDRVAHYITVMSDYNPECWINMNFTGIRERDKIQDLHFNLFALKAASLDLQVMRPLVAGMFNHYVEQGSSKTPKIPTWQYKPSMLVRVDPRFSDSPKKPTIQPKLIREVDSD